MPSFTSTTTGEEVVKEFADQVKGKTIVITGASVGGLGAATAVSLAGAEPEHLILAGRSEGKISPVIEQIQKTNPRVKATYVKLDLADQSAVRKAAVEISSMVDHIDILINNAGIMAVKDFKTTTEGIELHFGSNHVGPFLLSNLLFDKLVKAGKGARVVNVTSTGYELCGVSYDDWNFNEGKEYNPWYGYGQSKTANVLFAQSLADKLQNSGGQAYSVHPGLILESNLQNNVPQELFMEGFEVSKKANRGIAPEMETTKTLQQGCSTTLAAALDPSIAGSSGALLMNCKISSITKEHAKGTENKQKLWELSEKLVDEKFS